MALAIGVNLKDTIYVGDTPIVVLETRGFEYARVCVRGVCYEITDQQAVEILPNVFVSCGKPDQRYLEKHARLVEKYEREMVLWRAHGAMARGLIAPPANPGKLLPRLVFEAPRSTVILREELYEKNREPV